MDNRHLKYGALALAVLVGALLVYSYVSKPAEELAVKPPEVIPNAQQPPEIRQAWEYEGEPIAQAAEPEEVTLKFDGTVSVGETREFKVAFRDLSKMPLDIADYEAELAKLPVTVGKVTLTVEKMKAVDKITALPIRPGQKYIYVTYWLTGNADNPAGPRIKPSNPFDRGISGPPQPFLAVGDRLVYGNEGPYYEILSSFAGLTHPTHARFDRSTPMKFGSIWQRPADRQPVIGLVYHEPDGTRRLLRVIE